LLIFIANLIAAGLALGSAYLPWWDNAWPLTTDSTRLLTSAHLQPPNFWVFSIAMVIFVAATLMLLTALTSWKLLSFIGAAIGGSVLVLWFMSSGLPFAIGTLSSGRIGLGAPIMFAAVLVALIALFIPKHHYERERRRERFD